MKALALAAALGVSDYIPNYRGVRRHTPAWGSIAKINRHTGEPHEHQREIARRQRRA
jgi:hypothetical protein